MFSLSRQLAVGSARAALVLGVCLAPAACAAPSPAPAPDPATRSLLLSPAPPVQYYRARDGAELAYREFTPASLASPPPVVAIVLHGSSDDSRVMTVLGEALAKAGVPAFAPDVRGQGLSGRRGDIDYIGQLDDDLADLVKVVRRRYPSARLVLAGHSAGGGFTLRVAGEPLGRSFSEFVLISPYLGRNAPSANPQGGWARVDTPRILMLAGLNQVGVTALNGLTTIKFDLPPGAQSLGVTPSWSYRMMMNFGPRGDLQLGGPSGYLQDAARAPGPIVVIAGADDEQMRARRYGEAFRGLARPVRVELIPGVNHMGALSDPRAVALTAEAIEAAAPPS